MQHKQLAEQYIAASDVHDVQAALQFFAEDAVVHDEGGEHRGKDAIRQWMEDANAKYNTRYTVRSISESDDEVVVVACVSGTFPGSPIEMPFLFTMGSGHVVALKCGAAR